MKIGATMMAAVLLSSCMALAQVCVPSPGTVCLVPAPSAAGTTTTTVSASAVTPLPLTSVAVVGCPTGMSPQISSISGISGTGGTPIIIGVMPSTGLNSQFMMPGGNIAYVPISSLNTGQFPMSSGNFALVPISSLNAGAVSQFPAGSSFALVPISSTGTSQFSMPSGNVAYVPVQIASSAGMSTAYPSGISSADTAAIVNELRATRAQIMAASLEMRGQSLIDRMNSLRADEMTFRQQLAANPNLPNAQITANNLQAQAISLNNDIAAYNRELGLVPSDIRPQLASSLNTFDVVYWTPAFQQFAAYQVGWPQTATVYQPLFAANPWLQPWWSSYQTSLTNIAMTPTAYASARWWTSPQFAVAGSTEVYPGGSIMMLPSGAAIYFPAGTMPMSTTVMPSTTVITPAPVTPTPAPPAAGTTTTTPATTTPPATGTTGMY